MAQDEPVRPLRPGLLIGNPRGSAGTLGAFVQRQSDPTWIGLLSTASAIAPDGAEEGDRIHQPPPGPDRIATGFTRIARLTDFAPRNPESSDNMDAAIAQLIPEVPFVGNVLSGPAGGEVSAGPLLTIEEIELGSRVAKLGAGSGLTFGTISALSLQNLAVASQRHGKPSDSPLMT
jgi:hypothetical protein